MFREVTESRRKRTVSENTIGNKSHSLLGRVTHPVQAGGLGVVGSNPAAPTWRYREADRGMGSCGVKIVGIIFWVAVAIAGVLGLLKPETMAKVGGGAVLLFATVMLYTKLASKR